MKSFSVSSLLVDTDIVHSPSPGDLHTKSSAVSGLAVVGYDDTGIQFST